MALRLAIGSPLIATKGYPAPEVERTYSRAWALCDQLGRSAELFPVLRGLWHYHLVRGELRRAHDLGARLVALAEEQGAPLRRALARRALGTSLFFLGQFTEATAVLDEGIAIDDAVAEWENRNSSAPLLGARWRRVPTVLGPGLLVSRLPRPRLGEGRSWARRSSTSRSPVQPRVRSDLGRGAARLPTRVRSGATTAEAAIGSRANIACRCGSRRQPCAEALPWSASVGERRGSPSSVPAWPTGRDRCAFDGSPMAWLHCGSPHSNSPVR